MKSALVASALLALAVTANTQAFADDHNHDHDYSHDHDHDYDHDHDHDGHDGHNGHHYVHHDEWKRGSRMRDEDWRRGEHVDYREHHLRAPPHGYEWREVDGNYVLAAVATGVIASVIAQAIAGR